MTGVLATITRRPVTDTDLPLLRALYAETRTEELALVPWTEPAKTAFLASQFDLQHRHYHETMPDGEFWLLEQGDIPVGRLYLHERRNELGLVEIALRASERGHGIGTALIRETQARATAQGLPVRLYVEQFNRARFLYERLGFTYCGEQGPYFHMEWVP